MDSLRTAAEVGYFSMLLLQLGNQLTQHAEREIENDGLRVRFCSWLNQTTPGRQDVDFFPSLTDQNLFPICIPFPSGS